VRGVGQGHIGRAADGHLEVEPVKIHRVYIGYICISLYLSLSLSLSVCLSVSLSLRGVAADGYLEVEPDEESSAEHGEGKDELKTGKGSPASPTFHFYRTHTHPHMLSLRIAALISRSFSIPVS
jgi:hypothetical protein